MIFPQDVHKIIKNKSRIAGDNKVQLIIVLFVLGNVIGLFILSFLMSLISPTTPLSVTLTIHLVLVVIVGVFVFRFAIFDENAKKKEYQGQQSDSFTRYMYIRKDNITTIDDNVSVFEYSDGSAVFAIELRFGSNDDIKASGTYDFYIKFLKLVALYGFESRVIVKSENFMTSSEFKRHQEVVNNVEDADMRKTMIAMDSVIMNMSRALSNVDVVYFLVRSIYSYQKSDLEMLLRNFTKLVSDSYTAFRSISFLKFDDLLELYRDFYGIEAIDLAMMKAISLSSDITEDFSTIISVLSLKGESGKTYNIKNAESLVSVSEKQIN